MKILCLRLPSIVLVLLIWMTLGTAHGQMNLDIDGMSEINQNNEALRLNGSTNWLSFYNGGTFKGYLFHDNTTMSLANLINTGHMDFWTSNFNRMRITNTGNVGIGTLSPLAKLHAIGDKLRLTDPDNAARSIEMRTDGAGMDLTALGGFLYLNSTAGEVQINGGSLLRANHGLRVNGNTDGLAWSFGVNGQSIFREWVRVASGHLTANAFEAEKVYPAGTNADRYAISGVNNVDANWGYGVYGHGGYRGVYGLSNKSGTGTRYGVYGIAGNSTGTNYGVYGISTGSVGTRYAGYFVGNVNVTGTFTNPSDIKFKTDIETVNSTLDKVNQLVVKKYMHKAEHIETLKMSDKEQVGFIAQELQTVFPNLVSENVHALEDNKEETIEYLGVNYIGLIPILTKSIQELSTENQELNDRLKALETIVAELQN